ncbi:hypothetical protein CYK05_06890 [Rothia mucilaginosa]|nr:hypothetical protein CYK05_06890 [Rothia mucilaginosa]
MRYRKQLAKNEYWVQGIAVTPYGRSGHLPAGSGQEGFSTTIRAHTSKRLKDVQLTTQLC